MNSKPSPAIARVRHLIDEHRWIFCVVSLGVIFHISLFFVLKHVAHSHPDALHAEFPIAGGGFDSTQYVGTAENLLMYGNFSTQPGKNATPETFRTPGYPLFVAAVLGLTGTFDAVPLFQIAFLAVSALLSYGIMLSVSPRYKGIVVAAAALLMIDPPVLYVTQFITAEDLYMFFLLASVFLLAYKGRLYWPRAAVAGAALGVSAYMRPAGLYMTIPVAIWFIWRAIAGDDKIDTARSALAFFLVAALVTIPWYVRNMERTGVFAFSSLDAYNSLNFNLPVYLSYASGYTRTVEDIRAKLHAKIGNISDDDQMLLRNSALMKKVVWNEISPHLGGYALFHIGKAANFFLAPGLKLDMDILQGFWRPQTGEAWHPETSLVNSVLDRRWGDVIMWTRENIAYIPEALFLLVMFVAAFYWYWSERRSRAASLICCLVLFLGLLTSPISNPRYRAPVASLVYMAGLGGTALFIHKLRTR